MNLGMKSPTERLLEMVSAYYVNHPQLLTTLLEKLGAKQVRIYRNQIRCTCPIHGGSNPRNFAMWYDRGIPVWRCMSDCAERGGLAKLIMRKNRVSFDEAVLWLAKNAGIEVTGELMTVHRSTLEEESHAAFKRRIGLDAVSQLQPTFFPEEWVKYAQQMLGEPVGSKAFKYLTDPIAQGGRQFTVETLKQFEVGFVPGRAWSWWDEQMQCWRGWMEDRIAIPWRLTDGRCVGFSGRRTDGGENMKYKTLPNTGRTFVLYGLHMPVTQDAILKSRTLYMVEGFTDVWRAHTHGAPNTVALGGTELTELQLGIVRRLHPEWTIMYLDPDGPGMVAAKKVAKQIAGFTKVCIATPPRDLDPGDILESHVYWSGIGQAVPYYPQE